MLLNAGLKSSIFFSKWFLSFRGLICIFACLCCMCLHLNLKRTLNRPAVCDTSADRSGGGSHLKDRCDGVTSPTDSPGVAATLTDYSGRVCVWRSATCHRCIRSAMRPGSRMLHEQRPCGWPPLLCSHRQSTQWWSGLRRFSTQCV